MPPYWDRAGPRSGISPSSSSPFSLRSPPVQAWCRLLGVLHLAEEAPQLPTGVLEPLQREAVPGPRQEHEAGARDRPGQPARILRGNQAIAVARQDERRHAQVPEPL